MAEPPSSSGGAGRPSRLRTLPSGGLVLLAFAAGLGYFTARYLPWLGSFAASAASWTARPSLQIGRWPYAGQLPGAALGLTVTILAGWPLARLALFRTRWESSAMAHAGVLVLGGLVGLGLAGSVMVTADDVTLWLALILLVVLGAASLTGCRLIGCGLRVPGAAARAPSRPWYARPYLAWLAIIFLIVLIEAAASPVTEWDALIYHAASARIWYLSAPHPPLAFGSSVGYEISANYPPLFPAIGLTVQVLARAPNDLFLRAVSPLAFAAVLLLLLSHTRSSFTVGLWSTLLCAASPLVAAYAGWTTDYMLLAALVTLSVFLVEDACEHADWWRWCRAGAVAALAALTNYWGLLAVAGGCLVAVTIGPRRTSRPGRLLAFCAAALAVGSFWYLRNLVVLGDPIYPLGFPIFHGKGLESALWPASQAEIRNSALAYWPGTGAARLVAEVATLVLDAHLLPVGMLVPLSLLFVGSLRRRRSVRALLITAAVLQLVPALPGWFWLRALLPAIPILALLSGLALDALTTSTRTPSAPPGAAQTLTRVLYGSLRDVVLAGGAAAAMVLASTFAIAGPNQTPTFGYQAAAPDALQAVRDLGDVPATLWDVFGGDYLAWQWVNDHALANQRTATLEIRQYYFARPSQLWYLDGVEAQPLLRIHDPTEIQRFLLSRGVRYILIPAWALAPAASRHPALQLLPLARYLGSRYFPRLAVFAPTDDPSALTSIYQVGGVVRAEAAAVFPYEPVATAPTPAQAVFSADAGGGVVFAPTGDFRHPLLTLQYLNAGTGMVDVSIDRPGGRIQLGVATWSMLPRRRWCTVSIPLGPTTPGVVGVQLSTTVAELTIRDAAVSRGTGSGTSVNSCAAT